jgi:triphosphoribosyl-dephospho-CoA synthase
MVNPDFVASAAQLACLLEVSAPKPGNVSPGRHFHDTRYEDFLASAAAVGSAFALAGERPVGATVLTAVQATLRWTDANTNLGIVLLFAPLARAALVDNGDTPLRERVAAVLSATTVSDAADVYAAIRLAGPGGLGRVAEQDVSESPTATLGEVMGLARDRDRVAREYATDFATTFDIGVPTLERARRDGLHWDAATVETFLTLLASAPDSHIARKLGLPAASVICRTAQSVVAAGGIRAEAGRAEIETLDRVLRDPANSGNPGTTADLTAATLFVALLGGGWRYQSDYQHGTAR